MDKIHTCAGDCRICGEPLDEDEVAYQDDEIVVCRSCDTKVDRAMDNFFDDVVEIVYAGVNRDMQTLRF